jgi:hypothetical protein
MPSEIAAKREGVMAYPADRVEARREVTATLGLKEPPLPQGTPTMLSDEERAEHLGVPVAQLQAPFQLTPAALQRGKAFLVLYSPRTVAPPAAFILDSGDDPTEGSGEARFKPGVDVPAAIIWFPRQQENKPYLVEFHVELLSSPGTYRFRVVSYPPLVPREISLSGAQAIPIVVLIEPTDLDDQLAAGIGQLNSPEDLGFLDWVLYSVRVSVTQ